MDDLENPQAQMPTSRAARFVESREARRERSLSGAKPGFPGRLSQFLRDVRAEMKRVSWPSAKNVQNTTIITLIAVIFFAIYLFLADQLWSRAIGCDGAPGCGGKVTGLNWLLNWLFG